MSIAEQVVEELKSLSEAELEQVAAYLAFLKFRARHKTAALDETQLASLYAEFADEDRSLAEGGMGDYAEGLLQEDS